FSVGKAGLQRSDPLRSNNLPNPMNPQLSDRIRMCAKFAINSRLLKNTLSSGPRTRSEAEDDG
ncbi:MAG: hypothetical protein ACREQW_00225, partial [Candidatus Binatia bacterium]